MTPLKLLQIEIDEEYYGDLRKNGLKISKEEAADIRYFGNALRYFLGLDPLYQDGRDVSKNQLRQFKRLRRPYA